jgi:hypothetical protein
MTCVEGLWTDTSEGVIRGNVDSLMKLVGALDTAAIELIGDGSISQRGGRGVRFRQPGARNEVSSRKPAGVAVPRVVER